MEKVHLVLVFFFGALLRYLLFLLIFSRFLKQKTWGLTEGLWVFCLVFFWVFVWCYFGVFPCFAFLAIFFWALLRYLLGIFSRLLKQIQVQ